MYTKYYIYCGFNLLTSVIRRQSTLFLRLLLVLISQTRVSSLTLFFVFLLGLRGTLPVLVLTTVDSHLYAPRSPPPCGDRSDLTVEVTLLRTTCFILNPYRLITSVSFSPTCLKRARFSPLAAKVLN